MSVMPATPLEELQLSNLLEPIEGDSPTGPQLDINSFNSPLYAVKEARDEAEKNETQYRQWQIEVLLDEPKDKANWQSVIKRASDVLAQSSKDLRAAAWLSEALIRVYGAAGLKESLNFCVALCERYWDALHPGADDEEGHATAAAGLKKLFGDLTIRALGDLIFVQSPPASPGGRSGGITFQQYRNASEFDRLTDEETKQRRRERLGWLSTEEYKQVAAQTPVAHLRSLSKDLSAAVELAYTFGSFLRENCQPDRYGESTSPDSEFVQFRTQIEWMNDAVSKLLDERGESDSEELSATDVDADSVEPTVQGQLTAVPAPFSSRANGNNAVSREDAFRAIEEIAAYFEKQEPHSPVHFGLRQIVRWGRMSFPDLLRELLEDEAAMNSLRKRVGMPSNEESKS